KKNDELNQSLQYLNSPSFKERVAREQLNLKKEGETVYGFSEADSASSTALAVPTDGLSNPAKWWNYFFAAD
ncbi:MAG TPA: septum formation initiator family protein, partial [Patescibacteria group bacterium]|nr:septum formation initiator family protein [Patescibacteria group bacterium]